MNKSFLQATSLWLSVACLIMAVVTVVLNEKNRGLQAQLQTQASAVQAEAQTVAGTEQVSRNILTDLGNAALSNVEIRVLLSRYGYTLTPNKSANGKPATPTLVPPSAAAIAASAASRAASTTVVATNGTPAVRPVPAPVAVSTNAAPATASGSVTSAPVTAPVEPAVSKEK